MGKMIPMAIYAGAGIAGVISFFGLVTAPNFGNILSVTGISAYLLAVGGMSLAADKFMKLNIIEKLGVI